jgi:hypothetical protein
MSSLLVLRPGLLPVVHSIDVALAVSTTHGIPSITIEFSVATLENPVPVNVTFVPPVTVPYLGEMAVSNGVIVFANRTLFVTAFSAP